MILDLIYFYVCECLAACMTEHYTCAAPVEARRGHWISWNWGYRYLLAAMCMVGIQPSPL